MLSLKRFPPAESGTSDQDSIVFIGCVNAFRAKVRIAREGGGGGIWGEAGSSDVRFGEDNQRQGIKDGECDAGREGAEEESGEY